MNREELKKALQFRGAGYRRAKKVQAQRPGMNKRPVAWWKYNREACARIEAKFN